MCLLFKGLYLQVTLMALSASVQHSPLLGDPSHLPLLLPSRDHTRFLTAYRMGDLQTMAFQGQAYPYHTANKIKLGRS